ncbi:MAG: NAD(+) synthase [Gemmatimonadota bacterium]
MTSFSPRLPSPPLRLGVAQFHPHKGDVEGNAQRIRAMLEAEGQDLDLLIFPEAVLSGYHLEGAVEEVAVLPEAVEEYMGPAGSQSPDLILGFYEAASGGIFNSAAYLTPRDGRYRVSHVHRKTFLPTYGIFQESRFVHPGDPIQAFHTRWGRMGLLICEELWHGLPATLLALDGAELIVVLSASPARGFTPESRQSESVDRWEGLARSTAAEHGVFLAVAQLVGSEGGQLLQGASLITDPRGNVLGRGGLMESGITRVELDGSEILRARTRSPLLSDLRVRLPSLSRQLAGQVEGGADSRHPEDAATNWPGLRGGSAGLRDGSAGSGSASPGATGTRRGRDGAGPRPHDPSPLSIDPRRVAAALVLFLRHEIRVRRGFEKVVVGVSGGVDSAVSLMLAVEALGPENVHGFRLPYRTSSPDSLAHAQLVLEATGAHSHTLDITPAVDGYIESHGPDMSPLRKGNVAARMRALALFDQSARFNALGVGTGNKSERLLGYFTWHADDSPPINPLGDLFKTQVWTLARHLGVPTPIVEKPASADLVQGVHDADELEIDYPEADLILYWLLQGYGRRDLVERGFPEADVDRVTRRLNGTHWKRRLPTVAVLSSTSVGEFYLRPVDY